jgi:hypothetical protein
MKTGVELIAEERQRQIDVEKWDEKHDESSSGQGQLAGAAACYVTNYLNKFHGEGLPGDDFRFEMFCPDAAQEWQDGWPWDKEYDKREQYNS